MEKELANDPALQICLDCGMHISGRIDKNSVMTPAATHYNNQKKRQRQTTRPEFLKAIPKILIRNYDILKVPQSHPHYKDQQKKIRATRLQLPVPHQHAHYNERRYLPVLL
ncbi:MAG: hypothetical protein V4687_03090 [Bacteroidota bacterium]